LDSGFLDIGNHSWDHVHHAAERIAAKSASRDDFSVIEDFDDAQAEIRVASEFIATRTGRTPRLFAFPFGHVSPYLVNEYLPEHGPSFGLEAAFGTGGIASERDSIWAIPRVVCGHHWHSPGELERLLRP
jgi:peptidoglycan/xylan/chitin deacetylase (PgdA/CDA1 family)